MSPSERAKAPLPREMKPLKLRNFAPYALLPFLVTLGICLLARMRKWPRPSSVDNSPFARMAHERLMDGITFAVLMAVGIFVAFSIADALGLIDKSFQKMMERMTGWQMFTSLYLTNVVLGLIIGSTVVRTVRIAAHSRIVEEDAPDRTRRQTAVVPIGAAQEVG